MPYTKLVCIILYYEKHGVANYIVYKVTQMLGLIEIATLVSTKLGCTWSMHALVESGSGSELDRVHFWRASVFDL